MLHGRIKGFRHAVLAVLFFVLSEVSYYSNAESAGLYESCQLGCMSHQRVR